VLPSSVIDSFAEAGTVDDLLARALVAQGLEPRCAVYLEETDDLVDADLDLAIARTAGISKWPRSCLEWRYRPGYAVPRRPTPPVPARTPLIAAAQAVLVGSSPYPPQISLLRSSAPCCRPAPRWCQKRYASERVGVVADMAGTGSLDHDNTCVVVHRHNPNWDPGE